MESFAEKFVGKMKKIADVLPQTKSLTFQGLMYGGLFAIALLLMLSASGTVLSCSAPSISTDGGGAPAAQGNGEAQAYVADGDDAPQGSGSLNAIERERVWKVELVRVLDGDTIGVEFPDGTLERIRLIGIDAPESVHPDASRNTEEGVEASEHLKAYLTEGQELWLTADTSDKDRYGRLLRYVWLSDPTEDDVEVSKDMLNAVLVKQGYAEPKAFKPDTKYADVFEAIADGTYKVSSKSGESASSASASSASAASSGSSSSASESASSAQASAPDAAAAA